MKCKVIAAIKPADLEHSLNEFLKQKIVVEDIKYQVTYSHTYGTQIHSALVMYRDNSNKGAIKIHSKHV